MGWREVFEFCALLLIVKLKFMSIQWCEQLFLLGVRCSGAAHVYDMSSCLCYGCTYAIAWRACCGCCVRSAAAASL